MLRVLCNSVWCVSCRVTHRPSNKVSSDGSCNMRSKNSRPWSCFLKCLVSNTSAWPAFLSLRASFWDYRSTLIFCTCSEVREAIATAGTSKCGNTYRQAIRMTGTWELVQLFWLNQPEATKCKLTTFHEDFNPWHVSIVGHSEGPHIQFVNLKDHVCG
jgi:hypothetical protein